MKKLLSAVLIGLMCFAPSLAQATVSATYTPVLSTGDGSDTTFDFSFKVFNATELTVALVDPTTYVATAQTYGVDYTVTLTTSTPGGTVTFTTAPTLDTIVSIRRNMPLTQTADIPAGGLFREVQIENALDKQTLLTQQLQESINRAILQTPYTTTTSITLPAPVSNKVLGWNTAATALENKVALDADVAASVAASAAAAQAAAAAAILPTAVGDMMYSTDGNGWTQVPMGTSGQTLKCALDSYTKLLLHMDDAGLTDSAASKAITLVGGAARSLARYKFGGYSVYLDGDGDYLTTPDHADFDLSGGIWSVDFWIYPETDSLSGGLDYHIFSQRTDASNYMVCWVNGGTRLRFLVQDGGATTVSVISAIGALVEGAWQHVEITENGDGYYIIIDGVDVTAAGGTDTDRAEDYTGTFMVGVLNTTANFHCYIDEFRVSNGVARHTTAFTPPASEYKPIPTWTTV